MNDPTIQYQGDVWRIIGVGANNGQESYVHLASTTQYRQQKNGKCPIQGGYWLPNEQLAALGVTLKPAFNY